MEDRLKNIRLSDCVKRIQEVSANVEPLYWYLRQMIFAPIDHDRMVALTKVWMADGGRSAESGISPLVFEKLEKAVEAKKNPILNKFLYWYDVEAWLNAIQDRLDSTIWMMHEFYKSFSSDDTTDENSIVTAAITQGEEALRCYVVANTVFVNLASVFDLLSKIICEIDCYPSHNFSKYPEIKKSAKKLYNRNDNVLPEFRREGLLYADPEPTIVRKIETLRNGYVHNGPWDRIPTIYYPVDADGNPMPAFMLMPDMSEEGQFVKVKNRNKFYSGGKKLNEELIPIVEETLIVIENTLNAIRDAAIARTADGEDEDETEKAMNALLKLGIETEEIIRSERLKKKSIVNGEVYP